MTDTTFHPNVLAMTFRMCDLRERVCDIQREHSSATDRTTRRTVKSGHGNRTTRGLNFHLNLFLVHRATVQKIWL